jgi:ABC-type transporter Mla subunit MlaD
MSPQRTFLSILLIAVVVALCGCAEETAELKQKIAELEKKMQKQEKDLREFAGKFSPPKDFSADIQRIEDQQERISQVLKTKLDPVNSKLEEFRDWAQDAQKERENVSKKLKSLEQAVAEAQKKGDIEGRLRQELLVTKKNLAAVSKNVEDLSKNVAEIRKEALDNNAKIVTAVKNTLPKIKEMAVAELKNQITPLEQGLANLKATTENERKALAGAKPQQQPTAQESGREVQALVKRLKDLEEVVTLQKGYLLELGAKVHELEQVLRKYTN